MNKRDEILEVAKKVFSKSNYERTSLDEVAKILNITKPALYYYFKSKKDIYNSIFKKEFQKIDISKIDSLKSYVFTMAEFFDKNSEIMEMFSKELSCKGRHLENDTIKIISRTIKKLKEFIPVHVNPFFIQTTIISVLINYKNTIELRKKVANITCLNPEIKDIKEELYKMIENYIKVAK